MPLIAHSTCRAPASSPAKEFATASPRSSWQWTESTTSRRSGTSSYRRSSQAVNSCGIVYPTVSGMLIVVAPSTIAVCTTSAVNSTSARVASMGENSTSSTYPFACATAALACPTTSARVVWS